MPPTPPSVEPPTPEALGAALGLDPAGAEVVRQATRHVVRFPAAGARIFASAGGLAAARHEAAMATLLADAGVPATRLLSGPTLVEGWTVTSWREIEGIDAAAPAPTPDVLAGVAGRLHRATATLDPRGVSRCDPLGAALGQLEVALRHGCTGEADLAVLRRAATRLEPVWEAAVQAASRSGEGAASEHEDGAIVHGDLHQDNVVLGGDGPVMVDLELAGWGPRAYDAAPTVAFVAFYGRPDSDAEDFDAAYGAPVAATARRWGLHEVWALWSTCWSVANRHRSAEAEEEAQVRVATVGGAEPPRPWRLR